MLRTLARRLAFGASELKAESKRDKTEDRISSADNGTSFRSVGLFHLF